jgi:hypothetical protein
LFSFVIDVRIQEVNELLVLLFNFLYGFLKLSNLLIQLVLGVSLLIDHAVEAGDFVLLLIYSSPQVFALIVQLIKAPFKVLELGSSLRHLLLVIIHHLVSLMSHFFQLQLFLIDSLLL